MEEKLGRTCAYALLIALLATGVVAVATSSNFVSAQPCEAQFGSPSVYAEEYYYGGSFQVTLPVSASCPSYAGPLYAIGTAYDGGVNVGTANAVLSPAYGAYGYTGQLSFTLPSSAQYDSVQFTVSIYNTENGYGGSLLATASSTFTLDSGYSPSYPYYPYYPSYPSYPNYPSYPSYPSYSGNPGYSGGNWHSSGGNPSYPSNQNNSGWHYSGSNPWNSNNPHNSGNQHSWGSNPNYPGSSCSNNCNNNGNSHPHHHNNN